MQEKRNLQAEVAILKWVSQTFGLRHSPAIMSVSSSQISSSQHMTATSPEPHLARRPTEPEPYPLEDPRHPPEWVLFSGLSAVPMDLSLRAPHCPVHGAQEPYDLSQDESAIILFLWLCLEIKWEDVSLCVSSFCQKIVTREQLILCPRNYCVVII